MKKRDLKYEILIFMLIFISILATILVRPINDLDELWNYNFARNIANGLVPYKDFNMIVTPLLSIICGIILKLTLNELVIMRILATVLCSCILFIIYKIFRLLNIKKEISIIFIAFIGFLLKDSCCIDYNFATLLITLVIIYLEIKQYLKNGSIFKVSKLNDIILGILAGIAITLKQTSGICICVVLLGNKLLLAKEKEDYIVFIKSLIYRLIGILIPLFITLIYLLATNSFFDFISYTIKGIIGFSNYIPYKDLLIIKEISFIKISICVLAMLVPIIIIYLWYRCVIREKDKEKYFLLVYGLAIFVIAFPISNNTHFLIGGMPLILAILHIIYSCLKNLYFKIFNNKKSLFIIYFIYYMIIALILMYSVFNIYNYISKKERFSDLKHYRYIIMDENQREQIRRVDNYILNSAEKVLILNADAVVYMIPIDRYNKDYDMFNKGNFGFDGENRIIEDINKSKDTKYLILKDEFYKNWQTPLNIIKYVEENKTKVDEIEIFDVYK